MSTPARSSGAEGSGTGASARPRRRSWLVPFATFVGGVVVGVVLVGLLSGGSTRVGAGPGAGQSPGPAPSASIDVVGQARVNAACLRVINEAQDVYGVLAGLGDAVDDADLRALDNAVRALQPVQPRLAQDLQDCRVAAEGDLSPTSGASASATAPPGSTSPTPVVPVPSAPR